MCVRMVETTQRAWRHSLRRSMAALILALVALLSVGCVDGSPTAHPSSTPTAHASPTASIAPLVGITPNAGVASLCGAAHGSPLGIAQVQVGQYDSWQVLSSDLPLKPQPVSVAKVLGNIALDTITVDIGLATPKAPATGTVCAITARIVAYQPLAAPIPNVTRACSYHAYTDPGGADYGGDCEPIAGPPASATVAFASDIPGTTINVPVQNDITPGTPAVFPAPNGTAAHIWVSLHVPASGTYSVVFGLWQNQSGPTLLAAITEPFNLNATHEWSGIACTTASMQAQLPPPTNPPTSLLCPGAPPAA